MRSLKASSGFRMGFSSVSGPVLSGQNSFGSVPFGENMMINRWRFCGAGAPERSGRPERKGSAAAETPSSRRKVRR